MQEMYEIDYRVTWTCRQHALLEKKNKKKKKKYWISFVFH